MARRERERGNWKGRNVEQCIVDVPEALEGEDLVSTVNTRDTIKKMQSPNREGTVMPKNVQPNGAVLCDVSGKTTVTSIYVMPAENVTPEALFNYITTHYRQKK